MLKFVNSKYGDNDTYDMDDIRIIASDSVIKNNKMQYLLFDFEQEVSPGKYERIFKAIKMIKIERIPKKRINIKQLFEYACRCYYRLEYESD